ncbi:MAG: DUF2220 family protein [Bacteroidetes bacterium]|nr:DUF2220 family protein [Bacteroidota bacterium]
MSRDYFIAQLEKKYQAVLRDRISGLSFDPITLWGGKNKPQTTAELYEASQQFLKLEKKEGALGWDITWEEWDSKKFSKQIWPARIQVNTIGDYLFLTGKMKEFEQFEKQLEVLLNWQPSVKTWLMERPDAILRYLHAWEGITAVVDYFLTNEPAGHYLRSLPVPVHTKFIETYERVIISLLRCINPQKFSDSESDLQRLTGLKQKPVLFTVRWLDEDCGRDNGFAMDVLGMMPETIRFVKAGVKEVWLVENETALYMLPQRKNGIAIWARGKAIELLAAIPLFVQSDLYYWGDMDEEGFFILAQCRRLYPHTKSFLMNETVLKLHHAGILQQPAKYSGKIPDNLLEGEKNAFQQLLMQNGRLEQEQLPQQFIGEAIWLL